MILYYLGKIITKLTNVIKQVYKIMNIYNLILIKV